MENKKIKVELIGKDGNIFYIMGEVSRALKKIGKAKEAEEMCGRIMNGCKSYYEALAVVEEYVDIV